MKGKEIAIIGMACIFPGAPDLKTFWQNIVSKVDAVDEVPLKRWDAALFYDPAPAAKDKIYCKRGGYLSPTVPFNPLRYGVMPLAVEGGEPDQFLVLRVAYEAMEDAGYLDRKIDGERAEFLLGRGNYLGAGITNLIQRSQITEQTLHILKSLHPEYSEADLAALRKEMQATLPRFEAETAPAIIPNIVTGRVANRLGFMGPNCTIDAACASSLMAVDMAVQDLRSGRADFALAGGVHVTTSVSFLMVFSAMQALSLSSQIRPYDTHADGTMPGEGVGIVALKRLEDAERDGDRIYAVIKGVGTSSDGRAVSVTAPRVEGATLALRRAYEDAGVSPRTIQLIEGHGTGTLAGDAAEIQMLAHVFGNIEEDWRWCGLGTIKSMIGHAMPAAGVAGLIKTALALYHKVLPPTLHCESPNPLLKNTPIYVNTETRPWIHSARPAPRRGGIDALGFGGINAHLIMEEYGVPPAEESPTYLQKWGTEFFRIQGNTRQALLEQIQTLQKYLHEAMKEQSQESILLKDLAYTLNIEPPQAYRLVIVAGSLEDLQAKLTRSLEKLTNPACKQIKDTQGIYFFEQPLDGKLAFLFPGEGAQYLNMLSDLCIHFPEVRACFDRADEVVKRADGPPPSYDVFPPPFFSEEERLAAEKRLWQIERATSAMLTADAAVYTLFKRLGLEPDMMTGHSAGEWIAMAMAGIFDIDEFVQSMNRLAEIYRQVAQDATIPQAMMLAVGADRDVVTSLSEQVDGKIYIANDNCPHQVVIAGEESVMGEMIARLRRKNIMCEQLPYDRGYHTPVFTYMSEPLRKYFSSLRISAPRTALYSCTIVDRYPNDPEAIMEIASRTFASPLEFRRTIERMYADEARIFVEVGPKGNLTAFVDDILRGRPHLAVAVDIQRRSGITQLNLMMGLLVAQGIPVNLHPLYERREPVKLSLDASVDFDVTGTVGEMALSLEYPTMHVAPRTASTGERESSPASIPREQPQELSLPAETAFSSEPPRVASPQPTPSQPIERGKIPKRRSGTTYEHTQSQALEPPLSPVNQQISDLGQAAAVVSRPSANQRISGPSAHSPLPVGSSVQRVMQEYLQTMERFLEVQEQIMQACFNGGELTVSASAVQVGSPADWIAEVPVETQELLERAEPILEHPEPPAPPETRPRFHQDSEQHVTPISLEIPQLADTSADVQVEEQGFLRGEIETATEAVSVPSPSASPSQSLQDTLLSIVSEKTGYPPEMLGLDLDLEADLGIDSIKRIEILGSLQEQSGGSLPGEVDMEELASLKSLREVIDLMNRLVGAEASKEVEVPADSPVGQKTAEVPPREVRPAYPLVGNVVSFTAGQKLKSIRRVDWNEDLFIHDHTFGRELSVSDDTLHSIPVVPMTVSVEMMTEAASLLVPDKHLTSIQRVLARRWLYIELGQSSVDVTIEAVVTEPNKVQAKIYFTDNPKEPPFTEGIFRFGDEFPDAPVADPLILKGSRKPKVTARELYDYNRMFHGRRFQGVVSMDEIGEDGVLSQLEVLPTNQLFQSIPNPTLVTDPCLFDAAGQMVGYWPLEYLTEGYVLFPIRVEELQLFCETPTVSTRVTCQMRIRRLTSQQLRADMDIVLPDGRIWMRVIGWEDWRFYWPDSFYEFWRFPNKEFITRPISLPDLLVPIECRMLEPWDIDNVIWQRLWVHLVLNHREREIYQNMQENKRRTEWLFGRSAAKDVARIWLKHNESLELYPADIEIHNDAFGRPMFHGEWIHQAASIPRLSLSHSNGVTVAAVGDVPFIGVDVEPLHARKENFERYVLTESEQNLLKRIAEAHRGEWLMRLWCAKEAVAKATGRGLVDGAHSAVVQSFDEQAGTLQVMLGEKLAKIVPELAGVPIKTYTHREGDYIIAITICEQERAHTYKRET